MNWINENQNYWFLFLFVVCSMLFYNLYTESRIWKNQIHHLERLNLNQYGSLEGDLVGVGGRWSSSAYTAWWRLLLFGSGGAVGAHLSSAGSDRKKEVGVTGGGGGRPSLESWWFCNTCEIKKITI